MTSCLQLVEGIYLNNLNHCKFARREECFSDTRTIILYNLAYTQDNCKQIELKWRWTVMYFHRSAIYNQFLSIIHTNIATFQRRFCFFAPFIMRYLTEFLHIIIQIYWSRKLFIILESFNNNIKFFMTDSR